MYRARWVAALALAGLVLSAGLAGADDKDKKDRKGGAISDEEFVQKASAAGLAEVNAANMALRLAQSDDVRRFAQRILQDHTKANMELNALADRMRLRPAATMDEKHQKMAEKMARMSGADFDHAYMAGQVKAHEAAVSLFESFSKGGGKEDALRDWAGKTLPALQDHLKVAREIADRTKAGARDRDREKTGVGKTRDETDRERKDRRDRDKEDLKNKDRDKGQPNPDKGQPNP
jgi:putative membrane protein